jgi:hypothetical protein
MTTIRVLIIEKHPNTAAGGVTRFSVQLPQNRLNFHPRYATGILFISPLGDLVRRRQLIVFLAVLSASMTIGLAVTSNLVLFEALSFLIGVVSVTPQILIVRNYFNHLSLYSPPHTSLLLRISPRQSGAQPRSL